MTRRTRMVRIKNPILRITPRMKVALKLLLADDRLEFGATCVGRPTKQRLAKYGLARYIGAVKGWDNPMVLTPKGRELAEGLKP